MKKYLIHTGNDFNAFLSTSRNAKKHLNDGGEEFCFVYDKKGLLVSAAKRDPDTGKPYNLYIDGGHDEFSEDARKIFASLDK